jgi:O-acetyl-ADP-ribose deacetylase (regulator of RNase III)
MAANIVYKQGDMLLGPEYFIAHGCNAQGKMGSGVAKAVRAKYPIAYEEYYQAWARHQLTLGNVIVAHAKDRCIFNIITQTFYGRDPNVVYVDYDAIRDGILFINDFMRNYAHPSVAFPRIGASLGGGDWKVISSIIENAATFQPVVYIHEVDPDA